jgi:hypothetical protein
MDASRPAISVVVVTIGGWDEVKDCLGALLPQVEEQDGELIVGDSTDDVYPIAHPRLRVIVHPGESVFAIRAAVAPEAKGEVVAFTEDHCLAAPDWCDRILAAHRNNPEAALVGGRVENASTRRLVDWADFLMIFAPFIQPTAPRGRRIPTPANVAYKREYLPRRLATGELEISLPERLQAEGRVVMRDDVVITHSHSRGFRTAAARHYDNGRSTAGLALAGAPRRARRRRVRLALTAFPRLSWETIRPTLRRGIPWRARLSLPIAVVLTGCHTWGEVVGAIRGPGRSPHRVT